MKDFEAVLVVIVLSFVISFTLSYGEGNPTGAETVELPEEPELIIPPPSAEFDGYIVELKTPSLLEEAANVDKEIDQIDAQIERIDAQASRSLVPRNLGVSASAREAP